jgi:hypothetical protein
MLLAIAFWLLDIRNEELVNCGREHLKKMEPKFGATIMTDHLDKGRPHFSKATGLLSWWIFRWGWTRRMVRHRFALRAILGGVFAMSAFAACGVRSWKSPEKPKDEKPAHKTDESAPKIGTPVPKVGEPNPKGEEPAPNVKGGAERLRSP